MNTGFYIGIFAALFCGGMYLLYRNGMAVSKCIAAGLFVFLPGKNGYKVSLGACTGWIRHTGRFRERRTYAFALDARLSRGDAAVILLGRGKQPLLKLDRQHPQGTVALDGGSRYVLRWEFRHATGTCALRWR